MSNNKQQPKPENPNNQFSNTEPLTHAQRVAIANKMSNNKQSSVEFLWDELKSFLPENYTVDESVKILSILKQAKAMQKEQRINDFRAGIDCESDHHGYMWTDKNYPEQWYTDLQEGNNE